uniref:Uncharacterized protein n=1 Tax=Arundo donax TaxID=35708 RepID=A0A0A9BAY4_ARUDO
MEYFGCTQCRIIILYKWTTYRIDCILCYTTGVVQFRSMNFKTILVYP